MTAQTFKVKMDNPSCTKQLYLVVTADAYELPLCVSNRIAEVAEFCSLKLGSAYTILSKGVVTTCTYGRCKILKINVQRE